MTAPRFDRNGVWATPLTLTKRQRRLRALRIALAIFAVILIAVLIRQAL